MSQTSTASGAATNPRRVIRIAMTPNSGTPQKATTANNAMHTFHGIENAMIISNDRILKLKPLADVSPSLQKDLKLEAVERNHIIDVLNKTPWRVSGQKGATDLLGLKPTTLESRMKKLGITRPK